MKTVLITGCEKIDFGPDGGITGKSENNTPNGSVDESDWTIDEQWEKREKQLFKNLLFSLDPTFTPAPGTYSFDLYPNPVKQQFATFSYEYPFAVSAAYKSRSLQYVVIDEQFKVKQEGTFKLSSSAMSFEKGKYKKGKTYRMYYVLYDTYETGNQSFLAKGHGDIKITD